MRGEHSESCSSVLTTGAGCDCQRLTFTKRTPLRPADCGNGCRVGEYVWAKSGCPEHAMPEGQVLYDPAEETNQ